MRYSSASIAFAQWIPLSTHGSRCSRNSQSEMASSTISPSAQKTSWRLEASLPNTARQFTRGGSARQTPLLFATCANEEQSWSEKRSVQPSPIARLHQRVTARFESHTRRQLKRLRGCRCRRDGAVCSRDSDSGINIATCFLLWCDRIQAHLWSFLPGRRSPTCEKPRHSRIFHTYTSRYARAVGIVGTFCRTNGGLCTRSATTDT